MGKAVKIILGLVVAVIAVCAVVFVLVLQNLDAIIKQVIEDVGSEVVGTPVSVSKVKFTLQEGRGEIDGLTIANPPGFNSRNAFTMDKVVVQVEPGSITGPVIVISEVTVDGAKITAEQKGKTTNLTELSNGMTPASEEPAPPSSGEATDVRLMLEQFAFTNNSATVKTEQFGDKTLNVPAIRLSNIGDRETGLTPNQLASQMVSAVIKQAERAVGNYLEEQVKDAAKKEINKQLDEKLGEEDRKKLEGLKSLMKNN